MYRRLNIVPKEGDVIECPHNKGFFHRGPSEEEKKLGPFLTCTHEFINDRLYKVIYFNDD